MAGSELLEKQIDNLVKQGADRKQVLAQEDGVDTLCDLLNKRRLNHDGLFDKCLTHPKCDSIPFFFMLSTSATCPD